MFALRVSRSQPLLAVAVIALGVVYLRWTPLVPDLAAQVARAKAIQDGGIGSWWTGWFGGLSLPNYSVLIPASTAVVVATTLLARNALRPRAGAIAFAVSGLADLLDGLVTFVDGIAIAAWAPERDVVGDVLGGNSCDCRCGQPIARHPVTTIG